MKRPTISCAVIAKNESHNVRRWFESIDGCFDEIVFVDTGSTDNTVEIAKELGCKVYHFNWIDDFAAARNFSLDQVTSDFAFWFDLDDVLDNKAAFIKWRNTAMEFGDYWLATYHYALDNDGKPLISFARERVFRMSTKPRFNYFIHEGVTPSPGSHVQHISTWSIKHLRTEKDVKADRSRNLMIMEKHKDEFDGRMWYYYGKELYENNEFEKALVSLTGACVRTDLEIHDRILGFQYACYSAMAIADRLQPQYQKEKLFIAIQLAHQGLQLDPKRAELHCIIGECYVRMDRLADALPYFGAAEDCLRSDGPYAGAIFNYKQCYEDLPKIQKAKINFHIGRIDEAEKEAQDAETFFKSPEASAILQEIRRIRPLIDIDGPKEKVKEIVFTTPPVLAYEFDEELYKTKGMGGSETALIEVAAHLKRITGLPVKVFNQRARNLKGESGVEWISNDELNEYMSKYKPLVHIAWRHNIKVTKAPTFLWCHDLVTPGVEMAHSFDYILCLSEFHKEYVQAMQGVPAEKILLTRNGITPGKFDFERPDKNPNKLVWMSSPDRGLDRAMLVCDEARKEFPDIELHVYYGLENLYKYGMGGLAEKLKAMISERPWVKYHGFTEQSKMYREVSDAVCWVHPCNFIETFCITALEMLALGVYPVTRRLGALANTLDRAEKTGMATMIDHDCANETQLQAYVDAVKDVLKHRLWENVKLNVKDHSWASVADEWTKFLPLEEKVERNVG